MNSFELHRLLVTLGWAEDHWGHMKKTIRTKVTHGVVEKQMRVKFQKVSVRLEVRGSEGEWFRVTGDYLKNVILLDDGRLKIGTHLFKPLTSAQV